MFLDPVPLLSCGVAIGCVLASARRLAWAVAPTFLDPALVLAALSGEDPSRLVASLAETLKAEPRSEWERGLLAAFQGDDARQDSRARGPLVNEQLTELDSRAQRWARVPRVCARVAASAGFLFASLGLLRGLAFVADTDTPEEMHSSLLGALASVAIGICGLSFCVAAHVRGGRALSKRLADVDRLIARLEAITGTPG